MSQDRAETAKHWFRMLSPQEQQEAFMVLLERLDDLGQVAVRDRHEVSEAIADGRGDVDAMSPLWGLTCEPILEVGR